MDLKIWIYSSAIIFAIIFFSIYVADESGWWVGMENFVPPWGNNEILLLFIYSVWYLSSMASIYMLHRRDGEPKHEIIYYSFAGLVTATVAIQGYSLSDTKGNYQEAYYTSLVALAISLLTLILAWKTQDKLIIWSSALSFITAGYLSLWTYEVKEASGA